MSKNTSSIIDPKVRKQYSVSNVLTPSGRKSVDTGDAVAKEMRGMDEKALRTFARREGGSELVDRFDGWLKKLNAGQARMNLGNVVRGIRRRSKNATKKAA